MKLTLFILLLPLALLSFTPHKVTPYPIVGMQQIAFKDDVLDVEREILVWYPVVADESAISTADLWDVFKVAPNAPMQTSNQKKPVIVISHGYQGTPHQLSWLILGLVSHDFIVLGIRHMDLIQGKVHLNHWLRARDVSLILNEFTTSSLARFADLNQIGIAGFSLGGTTAILLEGGQATKLDNIIPGPEYSSLKEFSKVNEALPTFRKEMMSKDWTDPRIKAAFIMAPAWAWLFGEESLRKISTPTYLIAAAGDEIVTSKTNAGYFAKNIPNAIYQEIPGKANHFIFLSALDNAQAAKLDPNSQMPLELFYNDASVDRRWIQTQISEEAVDFFDSVFKR